jgi:hypothetical protein
VPSHVNDFYKKSRKLRKEIARTLSTINSIMTAARKRWGKSPPGICESMQLVHYSRALRKHLDILEEQKADLHALCKDSPEKDETKQ